MRFAAHRRELSTAALVLLVTDEGRAAAEGTAWRGSNRGTLCGPRGFAGERNDEQQHTRAPKRSHSMQSSLNSQKGPRLNLPESTERSKWCNVLKKGGKEDG